MNAVTTWVAAQLDRRPLWMNAMMLFSAYMAAIYVPWDFLVKPVAEDKEAWFGFLLEGWAAKATEPLHWVIYAAATFGFWRKSPWMWPWASLYVAQLALGSFVWAVLYVGGPLGWGLALASAGGLAWLALLLWRSREAFQPADLDLKSRYGDWAVVTGASAGLGAEYARQLAAEGMNCLLVARRGERLEELAADLRSGSGVEAEVLVADLATEDGLARTCEAMSGRDVGVLVNNAGIGLAGRMGRQELATLKNMVALNCTAPVALTHSVLPDMVRKGRGAVLVVGSVAGRQPVPWHTVYSATKAFDLFLGEGLWEELRSDGVDVLVVQPGPTATEFESVAGEQRPNPGGDEHPGSVVRRSLEALGRQPSVVSGMFNALRANVSRVLPRTIVLLLAGTMMARQTPESRR